MPDRAPRDHRKVAKTNLQTKQRTPAACCWAPPPDPECKAGCLLITSKYHGELPARGSER